MRCRSLYPVIAYEILQALDTPMGSTKLTRVSKLPYTESVALLKEMEKQGWVESFDSLKPVHRCYATTSKGKKLRDAAKPLMELKAN